MTSTLTPACPLCGLRYQSSPLLELHIREDHRQRPDPGSSRATPARADSPVRTGGRRAGPSRTTEEMTVMKATLHRPAGRAWTALHRAVHAIGHLNDELLRAGEAIIRSARAPRARVPVHAAANGPARPGTVTERAGRAA
jgi:hypothetical protein